MIKKNEIQGLILKPLNGRPIRFEIVDGCVQYRLLDVVINRFGPYTTLNPAETKKLLRFLRRHSDDDFKDAIIRENFNLRMEIIELKKEIKQLNSKVATVTSGSKNHDSSI